MSYVCLGHVSHSQIGLAAKPICRILLKMAYLRTGFNPWIFSIFDSTDTLKVAEERVDLMTRLVSECHDQAQQLLIIRDLGLLPFVNVICVIKAVKDAVTVINAL